MPSRYSVGRKRIDIGVVPKEVVHDMYWHRDDTITGCLHVELPINEPDYVWEREYVRGGPNHLVVGTWLFPHYAILSPKGAYVLPSSAVWALGCDPKAFPGYKEGLSKRSIESLAENFGPGRHGGTRDYWFSFSSAEEANDGLRTVSENLDRICRSIGAVVSHDPEEYRRIYEWECYYYYLRLDFTREDEMWVSLPLEDWLELGGYRRRQQVNPVKTRTTSFDPEKSPFANVYRILPERAPHGRELPPVGIGIFPFSIGVCPGFPPTAIVSVDLVIEYQGLWAFPNYMDVLADRSDKVMRGDIYRAFKNIMGSRRAERLFVYSFFIDGFDWASAYDRAGRFAKDLYQYVLQRCSPSHPKIRFPDINGLMIDAHMVVETQFNYNSIQPKVDRDIFWGGRRKIGSREIDVGWGWKYILSSKSGLRFRVSFFPALSVGGRLSDSVRPGFRYRVDVDDSGLEQIRKLAGLDGGPVLRYDISRSMSDESVPLYKRRIKLISIGNPDESASFFGEVYSSSWSDAFRRTFTAAVYLVGDLDYAYQQIDQLMNGPGSEPFAIHRSMQELGQRIPVVEELCESTTTP